MKIMGHHRSHHPFLFFSSSEKKKILHAIREAECETTGEIRVHVDRGGRKEFMARAHEIFKKTGMDRCRERNGILIFFSLTQRKFVILGDQGIHAKVPEGFWSAIALRIQQDFQRDHFADGIIHAIHEVGAKLKTYYPAAGQNSNELPDEISFSL